MKADDLAAEYTGVVHGARTAAMEDPLFAAQWKQLRRILQMTEEAMTAEGIGGDVIERVLRSVLFGTADPAAGIDRLRDRERELQQLRMPRFDTPEDAAQKIIDYGRRER